MEIMKIVSFKFKSVKHTHTHTFSSHMKLAYCIKNLTLDVNDLLLILGGAEPYLENRKNYICHSQSQNSCIEISDWFVHLIFWLWTNPDKLIRSTVSCKLGPICGNNIFGEKSTLQMCRNVQLRKRSKTVLQHWSPTTTTTTTTPILPTPSVWTLFSAIGLWASFDAASAFGFHLHSAKWEDRRKEMG